MLNVALQLGLFDPTTDESLSVEDRVDGVGVERIFGRVTDSGHTIRTS